MAFPVKFILGNAVALDTPKDTKVHTLERIIIGYEA